MSQNYLSWDVCNRPFCLPSGQGVDFFVPRHAFVPTWARGRTGAGLEAQSFVSAATDSLWHLGKVVFEEQRMERCTCYFSFPINHISCISKNTC